MNNDTSINPITEQTIAEIYKAIDSAVDRAVEKALLLLPDVMANLIQQQATLKAIKEKFIKENPDIMKHKEIAASIIEKTEGENPGMKYEDILNKALPEIRQTIGATRKLNNDIYKPNLTNGEL